MATSDVTIQDGLKHPYLLALVRWCVSSFWTTATVILHRLITAPIPQIKAPKPSKSRPANYDHLHPEPRVECEVLHTPADHTLDVIFVHGLYGSLGNTWRQGEWQSKYENGPTKVPLRRPHSILTCKCADERAKCCSDNKSDTISEHNTDSDISEQNQHSSVDKSNKIADKNAYSATKPHNDSSIEKSDKLSPKNLKHSDEISANNTYSDIGEQNQRFNVDKSDKTPNKNVYNITNNDSDSNIEKSDKIGQNNLIKCYNFNHNDKISAKTTDSDIILPNQRSAVKNNGNECYNVERSHKIQQTNLHNNTDIHIKCCAAIGDEISDVSLNSDIDVRIASCSIPKSDINIKNESDKLYNNIQKILPKENLFITEKFYNNTLLDDVDIGSYETHAQFVKDLFESSVKVKSECECSKVSGEVKAGDCQCEVKCEAGCGCVCDDCYSPCWPRDWIRVDYPGARVISINYTSDPYLWRPLWIKESKRLRLHERAEQMISQLLELGVGERPIIWVGHSKGGLFIKKIYCEGYEAHLKTANEESTKDVNNYHNNKQNTTECRNDNEINHCIDRKTDKIDNEIHTDINLNELKAANEKEYESTDRNVNDIELVANNDNYDNNENYRTDDNREINVEDINLNDQKAANETEYESTDRKVNDIKLLANNDNYDNNENYRTDDNHENNVDTEEIIENNCRHISEVKIEEECEIIDEVTNDLNGNIPSLVTGNSKKDVGWPSNMNEAQVSARAALWRSSAGFMFYSVPHRGSPLADIKTPITKRSVELMEICKDCPLVLSLQRHWCAATAQSQPAVRSLVETCRTLMSVLYLRIVSVDSADPGIGSLNGVDVDHREICKPSSRNCLLYRELMTLMETALGKR